MYFPQQESYTPLRDANKQVSSVKKSSNQKSSVTPKANHSPINLADVDMYVEKINDLR